MPVLIQKNINVLIIDDEKDICYLLSRLLKQKGIQAEYVYTLTEAKSHLAYKNKPRIIFLDNHLPDGLGVNFIRNIKKSHPLAKIIMITAHDTTTDREKAFSEGVDYFIGKPFSRESIFEILQAYL
jgi:two-component system OmpR family response regulator